MSDAPHEPTASDRTVAAREVYDIVGIGLGPANLALAVAIEETEAARGLRSLFLEQKPGFAWHPGMLLEGSLLQITVLKDLVTLDNPCSRFTFLNYLKQKGRLYEFLNLRDLFPTRIEFNDYLCWAAAQLRRWIHYDRQVVRIEAVTTEVAADTEAAELLSVTSRDTVTGEISRYLTRHLVLAAGAEPVAPNGIRLRPDGRILHPHGFKQGIAAFGDCDAPYRFLVVGAGQSGGEIFEYLMDNYPNADVTAAIRRFSYKPVDESDFTNSIFFEQWVDYYYELPGAKRQSFFEELKNVNYATIDHALIHRIYQKLYQQKVVGCERCRILPFLELRKIRDEGPEQVEVELMDLMREIEVVLKVDAVVLCTGYTWRKEHHLLATLAPYFEHDSSGRYRVRRDYSVASRPELKPRVYLQGYCEDTHGISETVLSLLPIRARDILRSVLKTMGRDECEESLSGSWRTETLDRHRGRPVAG